MVAQVVKYLNNAFVLWFVSTFKVFSITTHFHRIGKLIYQVFIDIYICRRPVHSLITMALNMV